MVNDGLASTNIDATLFSGTTINANANNVGGQVMDAGTATATTSAVNVVFAKTFSATPNVVIGIGQSGAAATHPGTVVDSNTGSFQFLGANTLAYNWTAIGSA